MHLVFFFSIGTLLLHQFNYPLAIFKHFNVILRSKYTIIIIIV